MSAGVAKIGGAKPLIDFNSRTVPEGSAFLKRLLDSGHIEESSHDEDDMDETSYSFFDQKQLQD